MIALGLWFLVLGVVAAPEAPIQQQTHERCSPAIGHTGGNVSLNFNCPGVDPKALEVLNREIRLTKEEVRSIRELLQRASATPDTQVGQQAEVLVREGKLREANTLLGRELDRTKRQLDRTIKQVEQKTRQADEWTLAYHELLRQARATPDTQVRRQADTLVRQGKLQEADSLLNPPVISMAHYQALQPGMSYQEVVRVLGRPGEEVSRGENVLGYVWRNPDLSMVAVVFMNGRMQHASQAGLRP